MNRQDYADQYARDMSALQAGVKRPKSIIGKTKTSSRAVGSSYTQPVGERSTRWGI